MDGCPGQPPGLPLFLEYVENGFPFFLPLRGVGARCIFAAPGRLPSWWVSPISPQTSRQRPRRRPNTATHSVASTMRSACWVSSVARAVSRRSTRSRLQMGGKVLHRAGAWDAGEGLQPGSGFARGLRGARSDDRRVPLRGQAPAVALTRHHEAARRGQPSRRLALRWLIRSRARALRAHRMRPRGVPNAAARR